MTYNDVTVAPPPWDLTGNGYIFAFRFSRDFVERYGFLPDELKGQFRGGFGMVMLVDYEQSPVGPYRELLFVPGLFDQAGQRRYAITKIYVSTIDSVINGQENWGIPKELADFQIERVNDYTERFLMSLDGRVVFDMLLETLPQNLPLSTKLLPVRPGFIQTQNGRHLLTMPNARGKLGFASIQSAYVDPAYFPDFTHKRPLMALRALDFALTFPHPKHIVSG